MASKKSALEFSLLSDANAFDLAKPADDLDDLGTAAKDAGTALDKLDADTKAVDLDRLGTDAKATATKVDGAFDKIAKSSRASYRKLDDDTDDMRKSLKDVGEEAGDTAREVSASFTGSGSDLLGGFQELAGQAGAALGPVGLAAGVAAAAGVGLITAQQEKLKEMTSALVQDMIDAGGQLNDAAIAARITTMATEDPAGFVKFNAEAERLGISLRDVARARAGDVDAIERVRDAIEAQIAKQKEATEGSYIAQRAPIGGLQDLRQELNLTTRATELAQEAVATAAEGTAMAVTTSSRQTATAWNGLRSNLSNPITANVRVNRPTRAYLNGIAADLHDGIGPIIVDVITRPKNTAIFYR